MRVIKLVVAAGLICTGTRHKRKETRHYGAFAVDKGNRITFSGAEKVFIVDGCVKVGNGFCLPGCHACDACHVIETRRHACLRVKFQHQESEVLYGS